MEKSGINYRKRCILGILIILFIIIISFIPVIINKMTQGENKIAYIYSEGELIRTIDLDEVEEEYTFEVNTHNGKNVITVKKGSIGVTESDCPDGLCVDMGFIKNGSMPVICLPHHLIIEIKGDSEEGKVDGKAY